MRYLKFVIENYRAITGPLEIDLSKRSLMPIIGINESGKTTVLQAIFAFDINNDDTSGEKRHLKDIQNLYRTQPARPLVTAHIYYAKHELASIIRDLIKDHAHATYVAELRRLLRTGSFPQELVLTRDLLANKYSFHAAPLKGSSCEQLVASKVLGNLPWILYFDDFRDRIDDKFELPTESATSFTGWLAILERLFDQTEKGLSLKNLAKMEPRQRKSTIAKVERHLNATLTNEWHQFRLDDREALNISLDFVTEPNASGAMKNYIKLDIVEKDAQENRHYFFISDRSKGFFWFFNFVMKLEFNPKIVAGGDGGSIYLLDEPGSYLHATAQTRLCAKLQSLSRTNKVIYCTHSHYLLDPSHIPFSEIVVAGKDSARNIHLVPVHEYSGSERERRLAFQPIMDALGIKPFLLDITKPLVVLVEGIYDFYSLSAFSENEDHHVVPSVGADSIKYFASLLIAWGVKFKLLWDNDDEGRKHMGKAREAFGDDIAERHFMLLPSKKGNRIMQNLYDGTDLRIIRERLGIPANSSYEKTVAALYFSSSRLEIIGTLNGNTRENFRELWAEIES